MTRTDIKITYININMLNKNKLLISLGIGAVIFILLQMFYVFALPKIVNIPSKTSEIESLIKENTNINAKIINPSLKTYWDFSIKIRAERLDFKDLYSKNLLSADNVTLKIQPLRLLFKQISIKELSAKNLSINAARYDKKVFGLGDVLRVDLDSDTDFKPVLGSLNVQIDNYNIALDDKYVKKKISVIGNNIDIQPVKWGLSSVIASGSIISDEKCADFDLNFISDLLKNKKNNIQKYLINGYIKNINLKQLEPYIKTIPNIDYAEGLLTLNFDSSVEKTGNLLEIKAVADNVAINKGIYEKQFILKGKNNISAKICPQKNVLNIVEILLNGNGINAVISGKIHDYKTNTIKLDIDSLIKNSRAEVIVNMLPYGLCKEINLVKKYGISGDVNGNLKIKGNALEPDIYGSAEATNVHALRNIEDSHTGKVGLVFQGKKANLVVDLITKTHQTFNLQGVIDVYDKDWSYFHAKTSDKLELYLVRAILVPVSEIFDFIVGPLPIVNIKSGVGNAELKIKGMKRLAYLNGKVNLYNTVGGFDGISALLTNVNVGIDFNYDKIYFYSKNFLVNSQPTDLDGHCTVEDGKFYFTLNSKNANSSLLREIVRTSEMLGYIENSLNVINKVSGSADISLKVSGQIDNEDCDFTKLDVSDFQTEGYLNVRNNKLKLADFSYPVERISGKINFTDKEISFDNLKFGLGKSSNGLVSGRMMTTSNDSPIEIKISSPSMEIYDTLNFIANSNYALKYDLKQYNPNKFNAKHSLDFSGIIIGDDIDLKTVTANVKFLGKTDNKNKNYISSGEIIVKNNSAVINDLKARIGNSDLFLKGNISNLTSKFPSYNLYANSKNLDLISITDFIKSGVFGTEAIKFVEQFKEYSGTVDANVNATERGASGNVSFKNLGFRHIKSDIPFLFPKFDIKLTNNKLFLEKITGDIGRTGKCPMFINLVINNYMKIPYVQGKVMTRLNPVFVERYINTKMTQPIKLTGNLDFSSEINGSVDSMRLWSVLDINPESDISYLTANLGDTDCLREFIIDTYIHPSDIILKNFEYLKYKQINSKNIKTPLLYATGTFSRQNLTPQNFALETKQKLSAKMLNFVFKKSLIKNGTFDASVKYTVPTKLKTGKPVGIINIYDAEIPTYGTTVKSAKIKLNENNINLISSGNMIDTDYNLNADIVNSVVLPLKVKNFTLHTKYLNLDNCINTVNKWSIDAYMNSSLKSNVSFDISDIIIDKGILKVDNIDYKSVPITNINSKVSIDTNSVLKIDVDNFDMAGGKVSSNIRYKMKDGSTDIKLSAKGVDSNTIANSFMGLKNQIQGNFTGNVNLKTKGFDSIEQLENLSGKADFNINDGSMPKLGSLEYLLHATNLLKTGLTALSVNGIIELLNPFKDGSFEKINGKFDVQKGVIKNMQIFSKGSHLSMYLNGIYDIEASDADIVVYGKFGRKTEGHLGGVGNLSLNTFFNMIPRTKNPTEYDADIKKIPDVTYKSDDYRVFRATVEGNINESNNSVTSFKWIK